MRITLAMPSRGGMKSMTMALPVAVLNVVSRISVPSR